jgi:hypothetical protein
MKYLLIGLLLIGSFSCNITKRLPVIQHDSIYVEKVKFDTIVKVLPGDTTVLEIPVDLPDYELLEENAKQKVQISVLKGKLKLVTICKSDSLEVVIKNLETKLSAQTTVTVREEVPVKVVPRWCWWLLGVNVLLVLLLMLYVYLRVKKIV